MRRNSFIVILILVFGGAAQGQSKPARAKKPAPYATTNTPAKPNPSELSYLTVPLDLTLTNLGHHFMGHDITAATEAIKNSSALKEKSEFEPTSAFESRRTGFVDHPLYASVTPNGYLGFVVGSESIFAPEFKYDADSQTLAITLTGSTKRFLMDKDNPTLDGVLIRSIVRDRHSYIGSNAFGAKVEVRSSYSEDYGVTFNQDNWLFRSSEDYQRKFTHLLATTPDEARALKPDAKLLLVCRLSEPWLRHSAHGHDATINEPYETVVGDNYLQVLPDQLWVFNDKTGDVILKLTAQSIATEEYQQMSLKLRQTPLLLEVSSSEILSYRIAIDEEPEESHVLSVHSKSFAAKHKIVFTLEHPYSLSEVSFKLNGKLYTPDWTKDATSVGSYESIRSATTVITVP